MTDNK